MFNGISFATNYEKNFSLPETLTKIGDYSMGEHGGATYSSNLIKNYKFIGYNNFVIPDSVVSIGEGALNVSTLAAF